MGLKVDEARRSDIAAIVRLNAEVQAIHHQWAPTRYLRQADARALFLEALAAADHRLLVARNDGRIVGYVYAVLWRAAASGFRPALSIGLIEHITVSSASRRCGVGRALLRAALAALKVMGAEEYDAHVRHENEASRALFAGEGFSPQSLRLGTGG